MFLILIYITYFRASKLLKAKGTNEYTFIKRAEMKNLILGALLLVGTSTVVAQEAADKKYQAGLVLGYGMNFQKMGTKLMETNGVGSDLTIGANVNIALTETIGFNTGVEFDFNSLKYKPSDRTFYFYDDAQILTESDSLIDHPKANLYELNSRKHNNVYLTIPTMMIFRTKFIGYIRYFGKFGLRNSFLLSSKLTDQGNLYPNLDINATPVAQENANMEETKSMVFFKSAVGLCGGAEWNFTGSTSLVGEIGYYYGFTQLHPKQKTGDQSLFNTGDNQGGGNDFYYSNRATQGQLMFKVSILF